jgi:hypothetical protein
MDDTTDTIEVTVRIKLFEKVNEEQAREIVENVDYDFNHDNIKSTEITEDDIKYRFAEAFQKHMESKQPCGIHLDEN